MSGKGWTDDLGVCSQLKVEGMIWLDDLFQILESF
jgi:hypothetical protein